jgi:tetratricopeptide (TPR) repeat protein
MLLCFATNLIDSPNFQKMKNWLTSLFSSKSRIDQPKQSNFMDGWSAYQRGKELLLIKEKAKENNEEALLLFDKAIECGINDAFFERAFCLQGLDYHYDAVEDFNQAILNVKEDANLYFSRGHSKKIIADYEGAISDLKKAVELSELPTRLNEEYNDEMIKLGWKSASQYFLFQLQDAIDRKEKTKNQTFKELYLRMAKDIKRRPK